MPKTLNPNNNFPTSITNFPISGNNEPIAIEPLEAAIQAVLDRTENLHQSRLTVEGVGVKRIRQFASRSALSAASGFADGDIVSVDGYGLYRLFTSSGAAADGLWVLTASGGGRWIHIENDLKGANGGLATLDSAGRLSQDVRDGSIATVHLANSSVTDVKLAPGAALANLGYTPLNKAGDTMTGSLALSSAGLLINLSDTIGGGIRLIEFKNNSAVLQWGVGHLGVPSGENSGNDFIIWRYSDTGNYLADALRISRSTGNLTVNGVLQARYDHQDRFVFCGPVGTAYTIPPSVFAGVATFAVNIPTGKSLYIRRCRFRSLDSALRLRVSGANGSFTSTTYEDDITPNVLINNSGTAYIIIGFYNTSGSNVNINAAAGYWVEFEIA